MVSKWLAILIPTILVGGSAAAAVIDYDGDQLWTITELVEGSSPFNMDTDNDGLDDYWEHVRGSDPRDSDSDDDGISDGEEDRLQSSILHFDTDGDGISDGEELAIGSDPTDATSGCHDETDCDRDGLTNAFERDHGSDPFLDDTDGDGIADGDEKHTACLTSTDCDDDGVPDEHEARFGLSWLTSHTESIVPDSFWFNIRSEAWPVPVDTDGDLIPDEYETSWDWGPFNPVVGQKDLLVHVELQVPSKGYAGIQAVQEHPEMLLEAYQRMARFYAEEGGFVADVQVAFVQTAIDENYARTYMGEGKATKHDANPFIFTATMRPFGIWSPGKSPLGLAGSERVPFLVNGNPTSVDYQRGEASAWLNVYPIGQVLLDHFAGDDRAHYAYSIDIARAWLSEWRFEPTSGTVTATVGANGWGPASEGEQVRFNAYALEEIEILDTGETMRLGHIHHATDPTPIASTAAHELGHTLGLCHTHEEGCGVAGLVQYYKDDEERQSYASTSTMSYEKTSRDLYFSPNEWHRVHHFRSCQANVAAANPALFTIEAVAQRSSFAYSDAACFNPPNDKVELPVEF